MLAMSRMSLLATMLFDDTLHNNNVFMRKMIMKRLSIYALLCAAAICAEPMVLVQNQQEYITQVATAWVNEQQIAHDDMQPLLIYLYTAAVLARIELQAAELRSSIASAAVRQLPGYPQSAAYEDAVVLAGQCAQLQEVLKELVYITDIVHKHEQLFEGRESVTDFFASLAQSVEDTLTKMAHETWLTQQESIKRSADTLKVRQFDTIAQIVASIVSIDQPNVLLKIDLINRMRSYLKQELQATHQVHTALAPLIDMTLLVAYHYYRTVYAQLYAAYTAQHQEPLIVLGQDGIQIVLPAEVALF